MDTFLIIFKKKLISKTFVDFVPDYHNLVSSLDSSRYSKDNSHSENNNFEDSEYSMSNIHDSESNFEKSSDIPSETSSVNSLVKNK